MHEQQKIAAALQAELRQMHGSCREAKGRAVSVEAEKDTMLDEINRLLDLNTRVQQQLTVKDQAIASYESQVLGLTSELSSLKVNVAECVHTCMCVCCEF